jgi:hypothetical protein
MSEFTHGHALLIGVGGDLPNTVNDAKGIAKILADPGRCAYPPEQVTTLTRTSATRARVLEALDALAQTSTKKSTVIVYFSGHGYRVKSSEGEHYFLLPYEYDLQRLAKTAISGVEFAKKLKAIPAARILLLLDCCHAGGVGDEKSPSDLVFAKAPLPPEAQQAFSKGQGRALIASSTADELSYAGKPYSAFTLALVEALAGEGASKNDGFVRWTDLALHAREATPRRTRGRQHPIVDLTRVDNFVLAYYAGGAKEKKPLPFKAAKVEIEPEPGAFRNIRAGRDYNDLRHAQAPILNPTGPVSLTFNNAPAPRKRKK